MIDPQATVDPNGANAAEDTLVQDLAARWQRGEKVALQAYLAAHPQLATDTLVALVRVDQRARWERQQRPRVEEYLQIDALQRAGTEVWLDLIYAEYLLREELHDRPTTDEYLRRFPQLADSLQRLLRVHDLLGDCLTTPQPPPKNKLAAAAENGLPAELAGYRIISRLGSGSQGAVYRAVHPTLGHDVVVKLAQQPHAPGGSSVGSMQAEGQVLTQLNHPNLARVYDLGEVGGRWFLVLDYVPGRTLEQWGLEDCPTPQQSARLVAQLARALGHAHRAGVVHQDVKPKNVIVDTTGTPHLVDFGLARFRHGYSEDSSEEGSLVGTLPYMAPEQADQTAGAKAQSDVFGLGGLLYFLLTRHAPYVGNDYHDLLKRVRQGAWDRQALRAQAIPPALARICARALAPDLTHRYLRADDLADDLERTLQPARRRWLWPILGSFVLGLAALTWWWTSEPGSLITGPVPTAKDDKTSEVRAQLTGPLTVRVHRKKKWLALLQAVPLRNGDGVYLEAKVSAPLHLALFYVDGQGKVQMLQQQSVTADTAFRYPDKEGATAPVGGSGGTEMLLLCGQRQRAPTLEQVEQLWQSQRGWPALPELTLLSVGFDGVRVLQNVRAFGKPTTQIDPEEVVRKRLEELVQRSRSQLEIVQGMVYYHSADEPD